MLKKILYPVSALILAIGFGVLPAHAVYYCPDGETVETLDACPTPQNETPAADGVVTMPDSDNGVMPISECDSESGANCDEADGSIAQPDKPISDDETDDDEAELEEEATEPEMWPVYVSLGTLGASFLLIIIINLIGRKSKK